MERFVYNQWDYGYRDQPIPSRADFGGRGNAFGIGAVDQGSYSYDDTPADAAQELQDLEIKAANDQILQLQTQINQLKSAQPSQVTQAQIVSLQSDLAKAKAVAGPGLDSMKKYWPYIAAGVGAMFLVMALAAPRRTA